MENIYICFDCIIYSFIFCMKLCWAHSFSTSFSEFFFVSVLFCTTKSMWNYYYLFVVAGVAISAVCAHATCMIVSALNKFDRAIDWSSSCEWQLEIYQLLFRSLPQFALRGFLSAHMPRTQHTVKRANGSRPFLVPNSHTRTCQQPSHDALDDEKYNFKSSAINFNNNYF